MSSNRSSSILSALRQAGIRSLVTILGLAIYWQLGMQDLHSLTKAAAFVAIANAGLAGLLLLQCRPAIVAGLALTLNGLVLLNASVEGFLFWLYGLNPKHIVVAEAILGSNASETREFIESYWIHLVLIAGLMIALVSLQYWIERRFRSIQPAPPKAGGRRERWLGSGMLTLFIALHLNSTMAEENPLVYWPAYFADYRQQRLFLDEVKRKVARNLEAAAHRPVAYAGPREQTLVLVLGESVNRNNWSLYGYARDTTPRLAAWRDQLLVFRNVVSSDAATAQSLIKMLTPATLDDPDAWLSRPNVLALARTAGYKVVWLSNQEQGDGPIQILAEHAHEQIFVNNGRGREARSLDERLLPHLEEIFARPDPRKLIVIHMQGAHLRYDLRYPAAFDKFSGADDAVSKALHEAGRSYRIRNARDQYDNAMLYTDYVLASILQRAQRVRSAGPTSVLYVSDHGQEVGHHRSFAGHSSTDPSGYQVPLVFWTSHWNELPVAQRAALEARSYRTDSLDHTLLGLLDIPAGGYQPEHDVFSARFDPAPALAQRTALDKGRVQRNPM
jgi:heptose-I-phosphate ethanolaminephosphotransferase